MAEIQYDFKCSDPGHPQDLPRIVEMHGVLDFVLGAARSHLRRAPNAVVVIARTTADAKVVIKNRKEP